MKLPEKQFQNLKHLNML